MFIHCKIIFPKNIFKNTEVKFIIVPEQIQLAPSVDILDVMVDD